MHRITALLLLVLISASAGAADWQTVTPGGRTSCSDGSPFQFHTRAGDPQKLLFYLQGGGACSTRDACDLSMSPTYRPRASDAPQADVGIFDLSKPDNPLRDYTAVFVPYCTGDVHLGDNDAVYPPVRDGQAPLTIRHRGMTNVQAALDWTFANVSAPTHIFVTGSSAGAIPSPFYASRIHREYPGARLVQLGDGAGGYRTDRGGNRSASPWRIADAVSAEPGFESINARNFSYEALYIAAAKKSPQVMFAQYDAAEDAVQKRFLGYAGQQDVALLANLRANQAAIRAAVPNFRSIIVGGESHTILRRPYFYTFTAGSLSVRDWVSRLVRHESLADASCSDCRVVDHIGVSTPKAMKDLWAAWEDPAIQTVEPFRIFDNLYYVGINWVAAYVLVTSEGLILIDSLYGKWQRQLLENIRSVGLDPADIRYVIVTHGHFDHAGGAAAMQRAYGARVVMTREDWALAGEPAGHPLFAMNAPRRDQIAEDGDTIVLGDTTVELFKTPGHTEGVLTLRYPVRDGNKTHRAMTLGGVGLNFSGVERTQAYIESYRRLRKLARGVSVTLPNHAAMGKVFERRDQLAQRGPQAKHPFVNARAFRRDLKRFIANAEEKLAREEAGTAEDPLATLTASD